MFGGRRPNRLARALDALARGDRVKVSEQVRGSPVHVAEVARVIHGIIDQMGAGAPRSGLYHYSGVGGGERHRSWKPCWPMHRNTNPSKRHAN